MGIVPQPQISRDDTQPDAARVAVAVQTYLGAHGVRATINEANTTAVLAAAGWLLAELTSGGAS